ncbi:VOC family protein [Paraburkholderia caribensis]|uniref:VOC family protein n=1 Tax=Paraburkholderia caribensis TaxID=75105 RepID=UPI001D07BE78|nr:VOC family protein [Paraburkholderia caribensis]
MPLQHLEHYLVQTVDFPGTVRWYQEILGLVPGPTPNFGFPVQWMYIGERDVLHITHGGNKTTENRKAYLAQTSQATHGTGVIDHVGFRCDGLRDTIGRLTEKHIEFRQRRVDAQGLYQLFLFDPNGVKVELNFPASEAAGLTPEVDASKFSYQHVKD